MRWTPGGVSGDIEDRRSQGGSPIRGSHLGLGGTILLILLSLIFKRDLVSLFSGAADVGPAANQASRSVEDPAEANWCNLYPSCLTMPRRPGTAFCRREAYRTGTRSWCCSAMPRLVLRTASIATGPFYCPADEKVYIDLGFLTNSNRFGAPGEFGKCTSAHEMGIMSKIWAFPARCIRNRATRPTPIPFPSALSCRRIALPVSGQIRLRSAI